MSKARRVVVAVLLAVVASTTVGVVAGVPASGATPADNPFCC